MKTEFVIYKGEIKFLDNQIKIRDGIFKWQKKMSIAYSAIYIVTGVYLVIRHFVADSELGFMGGIGNDCDWNYYVNPRFKSQHG